MYLVTCMRPDIAYAVRELTRFMSNYGRNHFAAAKHLLRYLQCTRHRGIIYGIPDNMIPITPTFHRFADADWASAESRKSMSSFAAAVPSRGLQNNRLS
jgi:hypothetical protein